MRETDEDCVGGHMCVSFLKIVLFLVGLMKDKVERFPSFSGILRLIALPDI